MGKESKHNFSAVCYDLVWPRPTVSVLFQVIVEDDGFVAPTQNKTKIQVSAKEGSSHKNMVKILSLKNATDK